ncbi:hypothetical protein VTJ04DRAFT_3221 [Mycothermus thermophilus]|uniref:uncharacterized protein n=1 Tax=Humicola insolens TaxID=85995 RepID=UPI003743C408
MSEAQIDSRSNLRIPGKEHIPIYPQYWIGIRIAQGVLAIVILGLIANGHSYFNKYWGEADEINMALAVTVLTFLGTIYHLVYEFGFPIIYNYWAVLGLDIFYVVMWLIAFPLVLDFVAPWMKELNRNSKIATSEDKSGIHTALVAGVFGVFEFLLFVASLVVHSIRLHHHRQAGLHCVPLSMAKPAPAAPVVVVPMQQQPPYPPQPQQPQAVYGAPPPQGGYYVPAPQQQQQPVVAQVPPQGFYSPSPPPQQQTPQPIVPQPTGQSLASYGADPRAASPPPLQQQPPYPPQ